MYTTFFGLREKPFSITPDPRYLFMSERHGEALAHLVYGVTESGGFVQLTGEVGTGKTTLVRTLLANRLPANANVAVVLNPQQTAYEFLQSICQELRLPLPQQKRSIKALIDLLNQYLLAAHAEGRRTILVVDEAQNLRPDVLEQVRLLTNLETAKQKLLQIILIGQPELRALLSRTDLRQLAQRITGRYHLEPLSQEETESYIEHRLKVAGALGEIFDTPAKREVYRLSQGIPRLINVICDRALLGAYSLETRHVSRRIARRAAAEISGEKLSGRWLRWAVPALGTLAVVMIAGGVWFLGQSRLPANTAPVAQIVEPASADAGVAAESQSIQLSEPETVTEPETATEPPPTLQQELQLAFELTRAESALAVLFEIWGLEYDSSRGTGCSQAEAAGYACFHQRSSWSALKQLDRPALLTLTDEDGETHQVVLTALHGNSAELSIGGVQVVHPVSEVSNFWFGRFMLLWKPPNGSVVSLRSGVRDRNVVWLRQSLASIDDRYRAEPLDSDYFDEGLADRVRDFQRDQRLGVDGYAGQQTQIIINSLLALDGTPQLTTARLARD